jgi:hypothetical protein
LKLKKIFYLIQWLDIYTCILVVEFVIHAFFFFLDEKVLLLLVVYEKYNSLLPMNFNAEIYKFYFTEKNFSKLRN